MDDTENTDHQKTTDELGIKSLKYGDYHMLLMGAIGIWGDGKLDANENRILNEFFSLYLKNKNVTDIGFRDKTDEELCYKEYLYWIFETIDNVALACKENQYSHKMAQKSTVLIVTDYLIEGIENLHNLHSIHGHDTDAPEKVFEMKKRFISSIEHFIEVDGSVSNTEKELLAAIKKQFFGGSLKKDGCGCFWVVFVLLTIVGALGKLIEYIKN